MASSLGDAALVKKKQEPVVSHPKYQQFIVKYPAQQVKMVENGLGCVRCSEIPIPSYYMVCKENGHILCGKCAWISSEEPESKAVAACCYPENLMKGSAKVLDKIIHGLRWKCMYQDKGCDERPTGNEWLAHVTGCIYKFAQRCRFYSCSSSLVGLQNALEHFQRDHGAIEFSFKNMTLSLQIPYEECDIRQLGILKTSNEWFLLCVEVFGNELHIWIWDLQTLDPTVCTNKDMRYRVALLPGEDKDGSVLYEGSFHHISNSCETIIESGNCFSIGLSRLKKNFLRKGSSSSNNGPNWRAELTLLPANSVPAKALARNEGDEGKTTF